MQQLVVISLPIVHSPATGVQGAALAEVLSPAGAQASVPGAMLGADFVRQALPSINAQTREPPDVHFFAHAKPALSLERERAWYAALSP